MHDAWPRVQKCRATPLRKGRGRDFAAFCVSSFTLIEMLVVLGIIGLVAAMSMPMIIPLMRTRKIEQAADMVKSACILARSKAIQERRMFNVTLLQDERMVIITDYATLRDYESLPDKPKGDPNKPFCAHSLENYNNKPEVRAGVLEGRANEIGERPRILPEGCRFALGSGSNLAWTYVFLPNGSAWTLPPSAQNRRDTWSVATYMEAGAPSGPRIYGPDDRESAMVILYATTGQALTQ